MSVFALRYRKMDADGDYVIGTGNDYYVNSPDAVAQAVSTRLLLLSGEWFLDSTAGVPWAADILGLGHTTYDTILREEILSTPGVTELVSYSSAVDTATRTLSVDADVNTVFGGPVSISVPIKGGAAPPPLNETPTTSAPVTTLRYRRLDENGDYILGTGGDFLVNSPDTVAQVVRTRLALLQGSWYLDTTAGVPWLSIFGQRSVDYDAIIKSEILDSPGVTEIISYSSAVDPVTRKLSLSASISTLYGPITVQTVI